MGFKRFEIDPNTGCFSHPFDLKNLGKKTNL